MGSIRREQLPMAVLFGLGGVALLALAIIDGEPLSFVFLAIFAAIGWWSWPGRRGRHVSHADAQAAAEADDVIVYWRPG
ncbi:MAG: hypothetical protein AAGK32_09345 [Actinomycetota bacterium]